MVTHVGEGRVFGVSRGSYPKKAEFQRSPNFWNILYSCQRPIMHNDQNRHSNTWGGARDQAQPRHCICRNALRGLSATAEFLVLRE